MTLWLCRHINQTVFRVTMVREKPFNSRLGKTRRILCQVREFLNSYIQIQWKIRELFLKAATKYFIRCFHISQDNLNYLSHPYFCQFMARLIILHSLWKLLYSQWKVREVFFCCSGWQPWLCIQQYISLSETWCFAK